MGSINLDNTYLFPLNAGDSFTGNYSSCIDADEILISVECDSTYSLTVNFSSNGSDFGIDKNFVNNIVSANANTYSIKPELRYIQVVLINTDINNQTYLRLNTIFKSTATEVERGNVNHYQIFDGSLTGINGTSLTIPSSLYNSNYTFYGNVGGATDLVVQISGDGTNFFDTQYIYTSSGSGNFGFNTVLSAEYVRLKSTNDVATVAFANSS